MKNKKGAIELSMSTIIVIILGVKLLTLGLMFIRGIFTQIEDMTKVTFEDADKQMRQYMSSGDNKFYILGADTVMKPKSSQRTYVGIRNSGGVDEGFILKVSSADDKSDLKWIEAPKVAKQIPAGEYETIMINIKVPGEGAVAGETYMYLIEAYTSNNEMYANDFLSITIE